MAGKLRVEFDRKFSQAIADIARKKGVSETEVIKRAIATYDALEELRPSSFSQMSVSVRADNHNPIGQEILVP